MNKKLYLSFILAFALGSCGKEKTSLAALGSITVVNAVPGGKVVKLNNYLRDSLLVNSSKVFAVPAGSTTVYFFPSGDSLRPYFNRKLSVENGSRYSLFFSGTSALVDTILVREDVYPTYTDSQYGLRFVNLYLNSPALKITLASSPNVSIFPNMSYQTISGFNVFPGKVVNGKDTLQVRDAATNVILTRYAFAETVAANKIPRFFNSTFVLKGVMGGTGAGAIGLIRVNHY